MQNNYSTKIAKNFKLALATMLVALVGLQAFTMGSARSFAAPQAKPAQTGELPSATEAKRALARISSANIAKIKDARQRDAVQRGYDAIKAVANNNSKEREAALIADVHRTALVLRGLPQPKGAAIHKCEQTYEHCKELCGRNGGDCKLCDLGNDMCFISEWGAARMDEGVPGK